jgi:hypothetical protein
LGDKGRNAGDGGYIPDGPEQGYIKKNSTAATIAMTTAATIPMMNHFRDGDGLGVR